MKPIYLDYAATTPVDPRIAEKMWHYLTPEGIFGNPSSSHVFGQAAKKAVEEARAQVAQLVQADPSEIIWTSGATESDNLALKGSAHLYQRKGKHLITLKSEHPAVLDCCQQLEKEGYTVTYLTPETTGLLDIEKLKAALRDDTVLVSIMHVNNETGVIQDIKTIAELTASRGILLHVDAAQSAGKVAINLQEMPVDLMSFASHKIYGPKGIGALYVRRKPRVRVEAQIHGGGQEQGMRSGTLPTHQIVGMGEAFAIAQNEMHQDWQKLMTFKEYFCESLLATKRIHLNGAIEHTVPHIVNLRFENKKATDLLTGLPDLAFSAGSACHSKGVEPSLTLRALGLNAEEALSSIRISFGRFTTREEVEATWLSLVSYS